MTVLFADLVAFTTYADQRDAEETRELLTRYSPWFAHLTVAQDGDWMRITGRRKAD